MGREDAQVVARSLAGALVCCGLPEVKVLLES